MSGITNLRIAIKTPGRLEMVTNGIISLLRGGAVFALIVASFWIVQLNGKYNNLDGWTPSIPFHIIYSGVMNVLMAVTIGHCFRECQITAIKLTQLRICAFYFFGAALYIPSSATYVVVHGTGGDRVTLSAVVACAYVISTLVVVVSGRLAVGFYLGDKRLLEVKMP